MAPPPLPPTASSGYVGGDDDDDPANALRQQIEARRKRAESRARKIDSGELVVLDPREERERLMKEKKLRKGKR